MDEAQFGFRATARRTAALVTIPSDDRSGMAIAYEWAWRIIVVSMEMVLPGVVGYWVDTKLGTVCLFLVIGLAFGGVGSVYHLLRMLPKGSKKTDSKNDRVDG